MIVRFADFTSLGARVVERNAQGNDAYAVLAQYLAEVLQASEEVVGRRVMPAVLALQPLDAEGKSALVGDEGDAISRDLADQRAVDADLAGYVVTLR